MVFLQGCVQIKAVRMYWCPHWCFGGEGLDEEAWSLEKAFTIHVSNVSGGTYSVGAFVTSTFFHNLEELGLLNIDDPSDMFSLHFCIYSTNQSSSTMFCWGMVQPQSENREQQNSIPTMDIRDYGQTIWVWWRCPLDWGTCVFIAVLCSCPKMLCRNMLWIEKNSSLQETWMRVRLLSH